MLNLLNTIFFLIILTATQANQASILFDVHLFVFKTLPCLRSEYDRGSYSKL